MGAGANGEAAGEAGAHKGTAGGDRLVFSSDDFGPNLDNKARLTAWHDVYTSAYGATDIDWYGEGAFRARSEFMSFEDAATGYIDYMFHRVSRTSRQIAGDNREDLIIGFMRDAPVRARLGGNEFDAPAGSVFFYSTARPVDFRNEKGRIAGETIVLPYATLAPVVPKLDDIVGRLLSPANPAVNLLKRYVELIMASSTGFNSPALQGHVRDTLVDLASIALGADGENTLQARERGYRAGRLAAVKADIHESIGRRDVSAPAVALRHGITPRYLHMLFEREERTFSEFVMIQRLTKAHRYLTGARHMERRISEIAFATGFADLSTFNRQFKRLFGMTPSEAREVASAASPTSTSRLPS